MDKDIEETQTIDDSNISDCYMLNDDGSISIKLQTSNDQEEEYEKYRQEFIDLVFNNSDVYHKKSRRRKMNENEVQITIKYFTDDINKLDYIDGKSDWIDLRAAETVKMKRGEFKLIPLGVAMKLPEGYEAHIIPRSSTFKNFGIIEANSMGLIDESYCGDNDQWFFPAFAMRETTIKKNDRICQFRIMKHQPRIEFVEVDELGEADRGGFGSTGLT